jgi:hypothetical protein
MNIERMKMAIERLNNLPKNRGRTFDYTAFFNKTECGTFACAAGELALYPPFMAMGLSMNNYGDIFLKDIKFQWNTLTLSVFLGITELQSGNAFCSLHEILNFCSSKITAKHVAAYLEAILSEELAV